MGFVPVLGLIFALVFALIFFGWIIDLSIDFAALTSGPLATLAGLFPYFWIILVGMLAVGLVIAVFKRVFE